LAHPRRGDRRRAAAGRVRRLPVRAGLGPEPAVERGRRQQLLRARRAPAGPDPGRPGRHRAPGPAAGPRVHLLPEVVVTALSAVAGRRKLLGPWLVLLVLLALALIMIAIAATVGTANIPVSAQIGRAHV